MKMAIEYMYLSQPFSMSSSCMGKISVALLVKRMMNRNKPMEYFLYFIIASLLIVNAATNIVTFTQCKPIEALWDRSVSGVCKDAAIYRGMTLLQGGMCQSAKVAPFIR